MDTTIIDALTGPVMGLLGIGLSFMALYIIYRAVHLKNKERLALIEKGMDPGLADAKPKKKQSSLKSGLLLIGIALGVLVGYILNLTLGLPNIVAYAISILIFCGIMLIYFHKTKAE